MMGLPNIDVAGKMDLDLSKKKLPPKPNLSIMNSEEKTVLARRICHALIVGRNITLSEACYKHGVNMDLFLRWARPTLDAGALLAAGKPLPKGFILAVHDLYKECRKIANENYNVNLVESARKGLARSVEGYNYKETVEEYVIDWALYTEDEEGEKIANPNFGKPKLVKQKVITKRKHGDVTAQQYVLNNLDSDTFKNDRFQGQKSVDDPNKEVEEEVLQDLTAIRKRKEEILVKINFKKKQLGKTDDIEHEDIK